MPLISLWFRGNDRLQTCLVSDPAHVKQGDRGEHVSLIQGALMMLDAANISRDEQRQSLYGQSTAGAVLRYKSKRRIINFSYETKADNVVGRMTIRALDSEMLAKQRPGFGPLLALKVTPPPPPPRMVIVSEGGDFGRWAVQVDAAFRPDVRVVSAPRKSTAETNVQVIKQAIAAANGGLLILSVGHGVCLNQDEGALDLAPDAVMRVTGRNSGSDPRRFVSIFYDVKPAASQGVVVRSDKENDERNRTPDGNERLRRFAVYQDLCDAFTKGNVLGVLLLTCKIGGATGFLKRLATQWNKPVIAYKDQVAAQQQQNGRVRVFLAKDLNRQNQFPTTNTIFAEVFFPLSATDMVHITP